MSRREDERLQNLAGRHPAACTCQDCTDRLLKSKKIKPARNSKRAVGEKIAKHPANCTCAICVVLGSLENLPQLEREPKGFLKRLIGRR